MGKSFKNMFPLGWTQVCLTRKASEATHSNAEKKEMVLHFSQSHKSYQRASNGKTASRGIFIQIISCELISGLLCCALHVCNMFSTCKTPHEALAALLPLALPEGVQLKLPETLRQKRWKWKWVFLLHRNLVCSPERFFQWGKMHHV